MGLLFLAAFIITSNQFLYGSLKTGSWGLALLWLFINGILGVVWFGVRYVIENEHLIIKIGPVTERQIPVADIVSVQRSYQLANSGSGPSFKKLKMRYKGGEAFITPAREDDFLAELKKINPRLFVDLNMVTTI